jgi:hypothetical protein
MLAALVLLLVAVALPTLLGERLERGLWGYAVFGVGAVALIAVAAAREVLRYTLLSACMATTRWTTRSTWTGTAR